MLGVWPSDHVKGQRFLSIRFIVVLSLHVSQAVVVYCAGLQHLVSACSQSEKLRLNEDTMHSTVLPAAAQLHRRYASRVVNYCIHLESRKTCVTPAT